MSETAEIGARVREAREERGMSQQELADEAGISQSFVSRLESGARFLSERGLLETLASALGRSAAELTGRPDPIPGALVLSPLSAALSAATWDEVPDVPARPVDELARLAAEANRASADARYVVAGGSLGALLVELHVQAVAGPARDRRAALAALCEACIVAVGIARSLGDYPVALVAGERARAAAARLEDPVRAGFASMSTAIVQARIVDRPAALATATTALAALDRADPDADNPAEAEAAGMLHLALAQVHAKARDRDTAFAHLAEAAALASRTGERRTLCYDFGPANTVAWDLSAHAELGLGPQRAEQVVRRRGYRAGLVSLDRCGALEFDLCRCFAQDPEGSRDDRALDHLNRAYLAAPERVGADPLFGPLVEGLERRGRHQDDELLDALKTRVP
ncbi:helix-turn-helix domain-containing protein [Amycolatopsis rubida]|uniref:Helix-turn-helix domain-containing protein n=1 Tax=Amycolatopsis rubida TaxID=112413 RepID=A0A1I5XAD3_9PSEU|nr:helix-turn-helix transcriptional regulator [Amycolatopsis rubida]SFQ28806.1 Helix-turn-helix domain-containing protein [Amycolatopsis rubida]